LSRHRALLVISFLAIHLVWGSTYLAIRIAIESIPPLVVASMRHLFGGALLFTWCWSRGMRPTRAQWRASAILSTMFFLVGHGTLHWAETYVPSGIAALIVSLEPVWVAAFTSIADRRRMSLLTIGGLVAGIAAIALLVGKLETMDRRAFIAAIALVISAFTWAAGMLYARSAPLHPAPLMSSSMTLLCGGAWLLIAGCASGEVSRLHPAMITSRSLLAVSYLALFGSLTFAAYSWLLTRISLVLVATHAYTNPLIAVLLGAFVAGEPLNARIGLAAIAVVAAIVLVRFGEPEAVA
jgi:drug/metabolite transporter (DMT)-like permease